MIIVDSELLDAIAAEEIKVISTDESLPFDPVVQVGPASIDLRLGVAIRRYKEGEIIDLSPGDATELMYLDPDQDFTIYPNQLWLASTLETIMVPPNLAGILTGRSSLARLGLLVHCSQEFINPGYADTVPLQLVNITDRPIRLRPHIRICQLVLLRTSADSKVPYFSRAEAKYKTPSAKPEPSRIGVEMGLEPAQLTATPSGAMPPEIELELREWREAVDRLESDRSSWVERIRKLELGQGLEHAVARELTEFVHRFAGPPLVSDVTDRSSFREDAVLGVVKDFILRTDGRPIKILDTCCGDGSWVKLAPSALGSELKQVAYLGVDNNADAIRRLQQAMDRSSHRFASFRCIIRDIADLADIKDAPFDVVLLHNSLHELCPSSFSTMLETFRGLLRPDEGMLSLIDMESLPAAEPEANAITWTADEVTQIIRAAGFVAVRTSHPKKVPVFHIDAKPGTDPVNHDSVNRLTADLLSKKLAKTIEARERLPSDPTRGVEDLKRWLLLTGLIARQAESKSRLERMPKGGYA